MLGKGMLKGDDVVLIIIKEFSGILLIVNLEKFMYVSIGFRLKFCIMIYW